MKNNMKKLLILMISIILVVSLNITSIAESVSSIQNAPPLHYMGAIPGNPENMEKYLINDNISTLASLPSSVDNSYLYPTPMNQTQSDCVAWAVGYALMANMQALNRNWTVNTDAHKFSPSFIYNLTNNGVDEGSMIFEAMSKAVDYGICPITYYSINNAYNATIPSLAIEAASLYKPTSYFITQSQTQIKQAIAAGKGVVVGIWVYEEMYYNMSETNYIYDDNSGKCIGPHAVCLVGYDDSKQAYKFINSWGDDWCQDGFGWIKYDFVASDDMNIHGENHAYIMNFASTTDTYVMGDANLDNVVTAADSRLVLRFSSGLETPTDRQYVLSDVDGDGTVTAADANNILSYASQTIEKFPLYE